MTPRKLAAFSHEYMLYKESKYGDDSTNNGSGSTANTGPVYIDQLF